MKDLEKPLKRLPREYLDISIPVAIILVLALNYLIVNFWAGTRARDRRIEGLRTEVKVLQGRVEDHAHRLRDLESVLCGPGSAEPVTVTTAPVVIEVEAEP